MRQGERHGYDLKGDKGRDKVTKTMIPQVLFALNQYK
jgi:hypothetical protein